MFWSVFYLFNFGRMKEIWVGMLVLWGFCAAAQETDSIPVDDRYLEDQFYMGITYNFLLDQPEDVSQRNLSYGLQMGFVKDIPLNGGRTRALGIGLGYGVYSYYSNLFAQEVGNDIGYSIVESGDFKRNKLETHMLELPIEFRWRNSTAADYKFWRVYAGVKLGYLIGARSKFLADRELNSDGSTAQEARRITFFNTDVSRFQYGLTISLGYNTFNVQAYYALNNLFEDGVQVNGQDITMKPLRLGFIFYIL